MNNLQFPPRIIFHFTKIQFSFDSKSSGYKHPLFSHHHNGHNSIKIRRNNFTTNFSPQLSLFTTVSILCPYTCCCFPLSSLSPNISFHPDVQVENVFVLISSSLMATQQKLHVRKFKSNSLILSQFL